jgi:hypothetical protein
VSVWFCALVVAVTISELSSSLEGNPHLGAAISAFKSLDVDQTGTLSFAELLRALFPLATPNHVAMMCVEVRALEVTKRDIAILQREFEWLDADFDGKCFGEDVRVLTDRGFLFGHEIKALLASGTVLLFACYDVESEQLVFRPCKGNRLSADYESTELVSFTSVAETPRWDDATSDEYGQLLKDDDEEDDDENEDEGFRSELQYFCAALCKPLRCGHWLIAMLSLCVGACAVPRPATASPCLSLAITTCTPNGELKPAMPMPIWLTGIAKARTLQ